MADPASLARTEIARVVALLGPEAVALSFNGGKDCSVLLHLLAEALSPAALARISLVNFRAKTEFPEARVFIQDMVARYGCPLLEYDGSIKAGLARLLAETPVKLVFLGNRATDPHCARLQFLHLSDPEWPTVIRCHPLLSWSYQDLWRYLRSRPYCTLYDQGYTSLGAPEHTRPNERLKQQGESYRPAYELAEEDVAEERSGRN